MRNGVKSVPGLVLCATTVLLLTACPEPAPETEPPVDGPMLEDPAVDDPTVQAYEAQLEEVDASGVTGRATVVIENDEVRITVVASGLQPDSEVPQHIHANSSCDQPGGIVLNLDESLSVPGEADPRGDHYPSADGDGMVEYEVTRSLDDLRSAAQEHGGPGIDELDLGNRVVNLHAADMRPVACGPLNPRN